MIHCIPKHQQFICIIFIILIQIVAGGRQIVEVRCIENETKNQVTYTSYKPKTRYTSLTEFINEKNADKKGRKGRSTTEKKSDKWEKIKKASDPPREKKGKMYYVKYDGPKGGESQSGAVSASVDNMSVVSGGTNRSSASRRSTATRTSTVSRRTTSSRSTVRPPSEVLTELNLLNHTLEQNALVLSSKGNISGALSTTSINTRKEIDESRLLMNEAWNASLTQLGGTGDQEVVNINQNQAPHVGWAVYFNILSNSEDRKKLLASTMKWALSSILGGNFANLTTVLPMLQKIVKAIVVVSKATGLDTTWVGPTLLAIDITAQHLNKVISSVGVTVEVKNTNPDAGVDADIVNIDDKFIGEEMKRFEANMPEGLKKYKTKTISATAIKNAISNFKNNKEGDGLDYGYDPYAK